MRKQFFRILALSSACLSVLAISYFRVFDIYELQTYDWRCRIRGVRPVSKDIVLVDIWNDSLEKLGAWPFDREYHADLIKILKFYGAKAVAFDVMFSEPRPGDEKVVAAAKEAGNVYFTEAFRDPKNSGGIYRSAERLAALLPEYRAAAKGVGHVNRKADIDGISRRIMPFIDYQNQREYPLSFQIAMDVLGIDKNVMIMPRAHFLELSPNLKIPLDEEGNFLVNFAAPWDSKSGFQHYSYYDIFASYLEGQILDKKPRLTLEKLKNKICIIGLTSEGSHDINPIPIQPVYPMVGLHANILNSILQRDFIRRLPRFANLIILFFLGLGVARLSFYRKLFITLLSVLLTLSLFFGGIVFVFIRWGVWADLFFPIVISALIYTWVTLTRAISETLKRQLIENELIIASQIQRSFLPEHTPDEKGLDLAVYIKPAKAVGGDLYGFVPLSEQRVGVMIGDVSGKGTPAALFMAKSVSEFKFSARGKTDPSEVISGINRSLASESTGGLFVTMVHGIFDLKNRKFVFANGGHLPLAVSHRDLGPELLESKDGMPVGVLADASFSNCEKEIIEGDCFAFYSDGLSEARNRQAQEYGIEALQKILEINKGRSAQAILDAVIRELNGFMGKAEQHDDITLIIVKVVAP